MSAPASSAPIFPLVTFKISSADAATPNPAPATAAMVNPPSVTVSMVIFEPAVIKTSSLSVPSLSLNLTLLPSSTANNVYPAPIIVDNSFHSGASLVLL